MLKLPTMSMDLFDNVLGNIDEDYPFSLSPKLILALLILDGICIIAIGIIFIWYKRKASLTSSMVENLIKLVPSLNEKIPTLNSLLPILSELTPSQSNKNALTSVAVPKLSQTPPDELVLPPIPVPKLQMETAKPSTTISVPYHPSQLEPSPMTSTDFKTGPLSLEMFNRAATNLNEKGVINLRRYNNYLCKKIEIMNPNDQFAFEGLYPANRFAMESENMAFAAELIYDGKPLPKELFLDIMIEKTQMLATHLKHFQLGLALVANISDNVATIKVYDICVEDSLKLYVTISNLWDIKDQLYRLWIEVNGLLQEYVMK